MDSPSQRTVLKVIVLGSSNVGKTSLMKRFCNNSFTEIRRATTGADFSTKRMIISGEEVMLQIWDTAGQERFNHGTLGGAFYRGADGAVLVYDVTSAPSFEQVGKWRNELLSRIEEDEAAFPLVVVGNKVDMEGSTPMDGTHGVDKAAVVEWCRECGMGHIEASAKDGTGVQAAMEAIGALALEQRKSGVRRLERVPSLLGSKDSINLSTTFHKNSGGSRCGCGGAHQRVPVRSPSSLTPDSSRTGARGGGLIEEPEWTCLPLAGGGAGRRR